MVGNGILAFAAVFVVIISVYISLRLQREKEAVRHFSGTRSTQLTEGFVGGSISLFVNDSLIMDKQTKEEPTAIEVGHFAEQNTLMIINNQTETVAALDPSRENGTYRFEKDIDSIRQLPQEQGGVFLLTAQGMKDCKGGCQRTPQNYSDSHR